jgi:Na+/H+ antiporter NhaD/arsenite permease-like protein
LGADFGGNLTLIGASANVVVAGMSERAGEKISFLKFMAYGIPVTLVSLIIATIYVLLRYYL